MDLDYTTINLQLLKNGFYNIDLKKAKSTQKNSNILLIIGSNYGRKICKSRDG
jgi:hypothetical protein